MATPGFATERSPLTGGNIVRETEMIFGRRQDHASEKYRGSIGEASKKHRRSIGETGKEWWRKFVVSKMV